MNFVKFLKIFGIVLASFTGFMGGVVGVIFVTGGFNPEYIPPEGLHFSQEEYTIDEDTDIFIYPTPDNATELTVELSVISGASVISVPETANMNEPITVTVLQNISGYNVGGVARLTASQGLYVTECTIYVDVPVASFSLAKSTTSDIYVGNNFTVSPTSVLPSNSLNPTGYINNLGQQAYYFSNKVVKYYSSDTDVATVNELTGVVTPIAEGTFTISARVVKTYNLADSIISYADYFANLVANGLDTTYAEEDYYTEVIVPNSTIAEREFTVSSISVSGISVTDNEEEPMYEFDLYQTVTVTPDFFGLELLPQANSGFTSSQLDYKLPDLLVVPMHKESPASTVFVQSDKLQITKLSNPLRYQITVLDFETWEVYEPVILFKYSDDIYAYVHCKILKNDVTGITITANANDAIELTLSANNVEEYDLEAHTTLSVQDPSKPATYSTLIYRVDLNELFNENGRQIIAADLITGYIPDNTITPLNRGTTRLKALVIETDINGTPVLDEFGAYNILFESVDYTVVHILEELETLSITIKDYNEENMHYHIENSVFTGETATLTIDGLTEAQITAFGEDNLLIVSSDSSSVLITEESIEAGVISVNFTAVGTTDANILIIDNITNNLIDYYAIKLVDGEVSTHHEISITLNQQTQTTIVMGNEAFVMCVPNSQGAFVDAYKYGKIEFISTKPDMIEINTSIDDENNIIVKLLAVGFVENPDGSFNADDSYSVIRARLVTDDAGIYFFNERVNVDIGAVEHLAIEVNSTAIYANPAEDGTQWLTGEQVPFEITDIVFTDPDNPRVTGVYYYTSDSSILEVNNYNVDENGNPEFIFKRGGLESEGGIQVTLIAKSLDPYAIPTDPLHPELGAYDEIVLTVYVPEVVMEYSYASPITREDIVHEELVCGDSIDLFAPEIGVDNLPRVQALKIDGEDEVSYNDVLQFEVVTPESGIDYATITKIDSTELHPEGQVIVTALYVGIRTQVIIRIFTDFGFEDFYYIELVPDVQVAFTYPSDTNPEILYPDPYNTTTKTKINLFEAETSTDLNQNGVIDNIVRVVLTDLSDNPIEDYEYTVIDNLDYVIIDYATGNVTINPVAVNTTITFKIYIEYATGIDYEEYYYVVAKPNIDIITNYGTYEEYQGAQDTQEEKYEIISTSNLPYNLEISGNVSAVTVNPAYSGINITDTLTRYSLATANTYVSVNNDGLLSLTQAGLDAVTAGTFTSQYVVIRVMTDYGYTEYYRVKIIA
ncbi:MAG: Ig-like domain-containing protein [Spirochaetales bacterium]